MGGGQAEQVLQVVALGEAEASGVRLRVSARLRSRWAPSPHATSAFEVALGSPLRGCSGRVPNRSPSSPRRTSSPPGYRLSWG